MEIVNTMGNELDYYIVYLSNTRRRPCTKTQYLLQGAVAIVGKDSTFTHVSIGKPL